MAKAIFGPMFSIHWPDVLHPLEYGCGGYLAVVEAGSGGFVQTGTDNRGEIHVLQ